MVQYIYSFIKKQLFEVHRESVEYPNITNIQEFPSLEACPYSQVHIFYSGAIFPSSRLINSRHAPHTSCTCKQNIVIAFHIAYPTPSCDNWQETYQGKIRTSVYGYEPALTIKAKKWIHKWSWFLLNFEMIVQRHLLYPCHQANIIVHCKITRQRPGQEHPVIIMNKICRLLYQYDHCHSKCKEIASEHQ